MNWRNTEIVIVTGDMPNPCGHMILSVDRNYYHFDGPKPIDFPRRLGTHTDYLSYLSRTNKYELMRRKASISFPDKAEKRLNELLTSKWWYGLFTHNCASFVKEILNAGGNWDAFMEICPKGNFIIEDLRQRLGI